MQNYETITVTRPDGTPQTVITLTAETRQRLDTFHRDIMPQPRQYVVFGPAGDIEETNYPPTVQRPGYCLYIDTRYAAKMRLYKYLLKRHDLQDPRKSIYDGTEIGKALPILNF